MKVCASILCALTLFVIAGCTTASPLPVDSVQSSDGLLLLAKATDIERAVRATSEARTATLQAATLRAGMTREASESSATATAQFLKVREQSQNLNATAQAYGMQLMQTSQAATETSEAKRIAATETGIVRALELAGSRTAAAVQATGTAYAATSTRSAEDIAAGLARRQATATAEALELRRFQAQEDAARSQRWADFFDSLMKVILGIGGFALMVLTLVQLARYLDAIALRQKLVETRSGTVLMYATREGGYSAQVIKQVPNMFDREQEDEFEASQLPAVTQEVEMLKVTTTRGETFIAKTDPEAEAKEALRKLALRLLRESRNYYSKEGFESPRINRIAGHRNLNWSADTWSRAVDALRPYLIVKDGRGGGTLCGAEYPTLMQLYSAVGERRITLAVKAPSPTAQGVSQMA